MVPRRHSVSGGRGRGRGRDRWIGASSSSGVPQVVVANHIRVATLASVELDMREPSGLAQRYLQFLEDLIQLCSAGGTRIYGIPCCRKDDDNPFLLAIVRFKLGVTEHTHQFLIEKGTLYLWAFTVSGGQDWKTCADFAPTIENSSPAAFTSQYGQLSSSHPHQSTHRRAVPPPPTDARVGPGVVLEALSGLCRNPSGRWRSNFKTMIYFIAEASRFTGIRDAIIRPMVADSLYVTGPLTPLLSGIVNHWKGISSALYLCRQHHGQAALADKDLKWDDYLDAGSQLSTGLTTLQEAINAMGILKI